MISFEISFYIAVVGFVIYGVNKMMVCSEYWVGFFGVVLMGVGIGLSIAVYPETMIVDRLFNICIGGACP